jgi:geranylgeranyl pyrophosphate synthase
LGAYDPLAETSEAGEMDALLAPYTKAVEKELWRHRDKSSELNGMVYGLLEGGGKRLRPAVCLMVCEALMGRFKDALPVAAAFEMAHSASLTQDDIIDRSPTRHNLPAAHKLHGVTTAILLSDYMIFDVFGRLADYSGSKLSMDQLADLVWYVTRSATEAAEGEYLEMALSKRSDQGLGDYVRLAGLKTGALFGGAAASGAVVGGAKRPLAKEMYEFGRDLGVEFQIVDDVLDMTGSTKEMGKPMLKDLQNNASNIVIIHAMAHADHRTKGRLRAMMAGSGYGLVDVSELLGIFDDLGSVEYASKLSRTRAASARERLKGLPKGEGRRKLEKLTSWLEARRR